MRAQAFGGDAVGLMNALLRLLPLVQMLLLYLLYFQDDDSALAPFAVGVSLWGFFFLFKVPLTSMLGLTRDSNLEDGGTAGTRCGSRHCLNTLPHSQSAPTVSHLIGP